MAIGMPKWKVLFVNILLKCRERGNPEKSPKFPMTLKICIKL
jgi:hypothetical protein